MSFIRDLAAGNRPGIVVWSVADEATRNGITNLPDSRAINAHDYGKVVRVGTQAPYTYYELVDHDPITWAKMGGGAGGTGEDGPSAYEVAVANGFQGNQQQWLDSLEGPQGETGPAVSDERLNRAIEDTLADRDNTSLSVQLPDITAATASPSIQGTYHGAPDQINLVFQQTQYAATIKPGSTWLIPANTLDPLDNGTYSIKVKAYQGDSEVNQSATLTINALYVSLDDSTTKNPTPAIGGSYQGAATGITITVNGQTYTATLNDGGWQAQTTDELAPGDYDVAVQAISATDTATTRATVTIREPETTLPLSVGISDVSTSTASPKLTGSVNKANAAINVEIEGSTYSATNHSDQTWTLAAGIIDNLANGDHTATVTAILSDQTATDTATVSVSRSETQVSAVRFDHSYYKTSNRLLKIDANTPKSFGLWVKCRDAVLGLTNAWMNAFGYENLSNDGIQLRVITTTSDNNPGSWTFEFINSHGTKRYSQSDEYFLHLGEYGADNTWRLVVFVVDGTTTTGYTALEGGSATQQDQFTFSDTLVIADYYRFGAAGRDATHDRQYDFRGSLAQGFIVNQVLTAAEITDLAGGATIDDITTPTSYWPLNGVDDTADQGTAGNTLTAHGELTTVDGPTGVTHDSGSDSGEPLTQGAVAVNGSTRLKADLDVTLKNANNWAVGGWFKLSNQRGYQHLFSSGSADFSHVLLDYENYGNDQFRFQVEGGGQSQTRERVPSNVVSDYWAFVILANFAAADDRVRLVVAPENTAANDLYARSVDFSSDITLSSWYLADSPLDQAYGQPLTGALQKAFIIENLAVDPNDFANDLFDKIAAIAANEATIDSLGPPRHFWRLSNQDDRADRGTVNAPLTLAQGSLVNTEGPTFTDHDTGGDPTPGDGDGHVDGQDLPAGPPYLSKPNVNTKRGFGGPSEWAEITTLTEGVTGPSAEFSATVRHRNVDDAGNESFKNSHQISTTAPPGTRARTKDENGDFHEISIRHHADGSVCIENIYADTGGTFALTNVSLKVDNNVLLDRDFALYHFSRTRPLFYQEPVAQSDWQNKTGVPKYATQTNSTKYYNDYQNLNNVEDEFYPATHDRSGLSFFAFRDINSDLTGPMGSGFIQPAMNTTGGRVDLGILTAWDAIAVCNPGPDNLEIVKDMGGSAGPIPMHAVDPRSNRMLLSHDHPKASLADGIGSYGNPIEHGSYDTYFSMAGAQNHAPSLGFLAAQIFGNEVFIEECEFWANYLICLKDSSGYRRRNRLGASTHISARGQAWCLRQAIQASIVSKDYPNLFKSFVEDYRLLINDKKAENEANNWYPFYELNFGAGDSHVHQKGASVYQHAFLTQVLGYGVACGFDGFKPLLHHFGQFQTRALNNRWYQTSSTYQIQLQDIDGSIVNDWIPAMHLSAKYAQYDGHYNYFRKIFNQNIEPQTRDFWLAVFAYTGNAASYVPEHLDQVQRGTKTANKAAYNKAAMAYNKRYGTPGANTAWAKLTDHIYINFSYDPRFDIEP